MTYQPLTDDDVFELFRTVTANSSLPVIVYDNPGTTHFTFTTELYGRIAELPGIASIKLPGVPADAELAQARIQEVRASVPGHVTIGVSGDARAAAGLAAGCDAWYSVIGGTLPAVAMRITRAARGGQESEASAESERLAPLLQLFAEFGGSLRVVAAIAEQLGLASKSCLPLPIQGLTGKQRAGLAGFLMSSGSTRSSGPGVPRRKDRRGGGRWPVASSPRRWCAAQRFLYSGIPGDSIAAWFLIARLLSGAVGLFRLLQALIFGVPRKLPRRIIEWTTAVAVAAEVP